jgi:hypothetical protein
VAITTIYFALFAFLTFSNCLGQEKVSFDFEKREMLTPIKMPDDSISMTASPDNSTVSTLFDKFSINLQTAKDALSGAVFTGFRVPVKTVPGKNLFITIKICEEPLTRFGYKNCFISQFRRRADNYRVSVWKKDEGNLFRSFPRQVRNVGTNSYLATLAITVERGNVNEKVDVLFANMKTK